MAVCRRVTLRRLLRLRLSCMVWWFRPDTDLLRRRLGPARLSHPEVYNAIIEELERTGVEIDFRKGQCAYSPAKGQPGRIILDPDASLGALRHEFRHFLDVRDDGYPGLAYYYVHVDLFVRLEKRAYREEIVIARELGDRRLVRRILIQMVQRIDELCGR